MNLETIADIGQIIFADIILSGDNALVIGMAAAGLTPELRKRAIMLGMALAAILRILFAVVATHLLAIKGVLLIGGLLLIWVCWRFYQDLREFNSADDLVEPAIHSDATGDVNNTGQENKFFGRALFTILLADVSMSIDNIVAVAAIARDDTKLLVFGLGLAILMMALFASVIMKIMLRYRWLSYLGLGFLCYLSAMMLYDGTAELAGWQ